MGLFHCPAGAVGRGGDGCIGCGLCCATNKGERQRATAIVRDHIRKTTTRNPKLLIRKIAVCGKGGVGKSTVTALISDVLSEMGYECLVIDTDHSNNGLHLKLGLQEPPHPLYDLIEEKGIQNLKWLQKESLTFDDIPDEIAPFCGTRRLLAVGKIDDPLQGCACAMSAYEKSLIENLQPDDRQILLADQEAGVESFGRGIETASDTILIVVEPSRESLELAKKIQYMAQGLGIRRIRAIINKAEDEEQITYIQEELSKSNVRFLGALPMQKRWKTANMKGEALTAERLDQDVRLIVKYLLDEAEMPYRKIIL